MVTCYVINGGGLYVRLSPAKFLKAEREGLVRGLGVEAAAVREAAYGPRTDYR